MLDTEQVEALFQTLKRENPYPKVELYYTNIYTLLVAVILSARATDKSVDKATKPLFDRVSSPLEMLELGEDELRKFIKSVGLYRTKARHIIQLSQVIINFFNGVVPDSREELMKLPGVGRKTSNVVLNLAFGQPAIAVDSHLLRVANRTGLCSERTPVAVEKCLERRLSRELWYNCHQWLVLHGRYICKARRPRCSCCPIYKHCQYSQKSIKVLD